MPTSNNRVAIGLDVGGTKLKAVALSANGTVLDETVVPSRANETPESVRKAMHDAVTHFHEAGHTFVSIGVGCAGSVDHFKGVVRNSPNFADWKNVPLKEWMEKDFSVPVSVENDANCATLTEWKVGNAQDFRNVLLLTLGTGIGSGLILNGQLYRGSTGTAGEIGHMSIRTDGIECPCGNRGCFERYCSATAIKIRANGVSPKEVFAHAETNPAFGRIISEFLSDFKVALTSLANIFDPDCIVLGGAVTEGVARYLPEIHSWIARHAFPTVGTRVKLRTTKYENLSGAIGAALLSLEGFSG